MNSPLPARRRAQLVAENISVALGTRPIFTRLSLALAPGDRLFVVGENGRGKTTLLHTLTGHLLPDSGRITRHGTIALAEQQMPAGDGRTVGDAVRETIRPAEQALQRLEAALATIESDPEEYEAALATAELLDAWDARRRVTAALAALAADFGDDVPLAELSVGQRYRVRLACLLGTHHDHLLLDEPTNHLDHAGLTYLTAQLRQRRGSVLIVSHDRALLADLATTVLDLDPTPDGLPRTWGGDYEGYRAGRTALEQAWADDYAAQTTRQAQLRADLQQAQARLSTGWRPPKGTGKHTRQSHTPGVVQAVKRRQEALEAAAVTLPPPPPAFTFPRLSARSTRTYLRAEGISVAGRLAGPVDLALRGGDRLVVTGPNGAGKSTLLDVLTGVLSPTTGSVSVPDPGRIGRLQQESGEEADTLSMGQRRRRDIARLLAATPSVLLLDEPTNHLASTAVEQLTRALEETEAAVILVTHDRRLLADTAHWPRLQLTPADVPPATPAGGSLR
ncbi:ABC-F family ATP-binding cassette domain-containing protein [Corynebacterium hylobatis]|uniref:ABC-F family ATP-binding cassette domain-containing protein n=1 Tax=Corynebacterium hylobatis TaxID=1859290 RepID=A0A3S0HH37_9CORY|nr:ATP-binding cassette domain-containing protein [Corynebacterium hylobatis]RSZ63407.1 ABC-F family ATP-binding cassette domain-containing protein [Corynebacterium hylobatis]